MKFIVVTDMRGERYAYPVEPLIHARDATESERNTGANAAIVMIDRTRPDGRWIEFLCTETLDNILKQLRGEPTFMGVAGSMFADHPTSAPDLGAHRGQTTTP